MSKRSMKLKGWISWMPFNWLRKKLVGLKVKKVFKKGGYDHKGSVVEKDGSTIITFSLK